MAPNNTRLPLILLITDSQIVVGERIERKGDRVFIRNYMTGRKATYIDSGVNPHRKILDEYRSKRALGPNHFDGIMAGPAEFPLANDVSLDEGIDLTWEANYVQTGRLHHFKIFQRNSKERTFRHLVEY